MNREALLVLSKDDLVDLVLAQQAQVAAQAAQIAAQAAQIEVLTAQVATLSTRVIELEAKLNVPPPLPFQQCFALPELRRRDLGVAPTWRAAMAAAGAVSDCG